MIYSLVPKIKSKAVGIKAELFSQKIKIFFP